MIKKAKRGAPVKGSVSLPEPVDIHVGSRLKFRRSLMNLSQTELAKS